MSELNEEIKIVSPGKAEIEFQLKVGDIRNLGQTDFEDTIVELNDTWVYWQESIGGKVVGEYGDPIKVNSELRYRADMRLKHPSSTVHRRTSEGIVPVWPEMEGASENRPTFEEALRASFDKYGNALARLAGTEEVQP
jgi:hypothetical protein